MQTGAQNISFLYCTVCIQDDAGVRKGKCIARGKVLPSVYRLDHHRQQQHISADFIDRLKVRTFVSISVDDRSTEIKDVVYILSQRVLP